MHIANTVIMAVALLLTAALLVWSQDRYTEAMIVMAARAQAAESRVQTAELRCMAVENRIDETLGGYESAVRITKGRR